MPSTQTAKSRAPSLHHFLLPVMANVSGKARNKVRHQNGAYSVHTEVQHQVFFHFTDTRNLPSIKVNGGLLSMVEMRRRGIPVICPGGNEWSQEADARFGVDRYVHLCLLNEHPMEYLARQDGRIGQSVFLQVSPTILHLDGVAFVPEVSNKVGARLLTLAEADIEMDFEVIYTRTDWRDPAIQERRRVAKKYELLVPNCVPLNYLVGP